MVIYCLKALTSLLRIQNHFQLKGVHCLVKQILNQYQYFFKAPILTMFGIFVEIKIWQTFLCLAFCQD